MNTTQLIITFVAILAGLAFGYFISKALLAKNVKLQEEGAESKAKDIIRLAEEKSDNIRNQRILEAKEKFLRLKSEFDEDANKKRQIIAQNEQKVKDRERQLAQMMEDGKRKETELDKQKTQLTQREDASKRKQEEAEKMLAGFFGG